MIAFPPQKRPSIREQVAAWLELMKSTPDRTREHVESHLSCPQCGEALVVRWARNSERWHAYHPLNRLWCESSGASWWGDTRAEAIENFQNGGDCHATADRSTVEATAAPKVPPSGAATLQGWEFSAEGADEEEINKLLSHK